MSGAKYCPPTDDEIIALRRTTKAQDYTRPFGDTLAFARALLDLYAAPAQAEPRGNEPENIYDMVQRQAEDPGLWFRAQTAAEAYIQEHLRQLHAQVERAYRAAPSPAAEDGLDEETLRKLSRTEMIRVLYEFKSERDAAKTSAMHAFEERDLARQEAAALRRATKVIEDYPNYGGTD